MNQWLRNDCRHRDAFAIWSDHKDIEFKWFAPPIEVVEEFVRNHDAAMREFKHFGYGNQFGVHLIDLGRTTEGFYDTAMNEVSDA